MRSKILVTGGAGFIGSAYVRLLVARGYRVSVIDSLTYAGDKARLDEVKGKFAFYKADITDAPRIEALVRRIKPRFVVHFAAETHVDRSLQDPGPFVWTNVQGTCALLEGARRSPNLGRFLHVSTDEVYGDAAETGPLDEDSPLRPCNPYSVTKAAAEQMVGAYARAWKIPAVVVRPTNNFGPRQFPEKFVPTVTTRALLGERVPLYGDGRL